MHPLRPTEVARGAERFECTRSHIARADSTRTNMHLQMCKVLTNAALLPKHLFRCRADVSGFRIESEFFVDSSRQIEECIRQHPAFREQLPGVRFKLGFRPNSRRFGHKLIRIQRFHRCDLCGSQRLLAPREV